MAVVEDGTVSLVGPGTATITATTHAEPSLSASCEVFCDKLGDVRLSGLLRDADGGANWVEFGAGDRMIGLPFRKRMPFPLAVPL